MRKELVYSFIAAGAIPVAVNAATGQAYKASDVQVATTGGLNVSIGKLVPGTYKLVSDAISGEAADVKLEYKITIAGVAGSAKTLELTKKLNEEFTVTAESEVSVLLTAVESANNVYVPGLAVTIDFDFKTLANELQKQYNDLVNEIKAYSYVGTTDDLAKYGNYQSKITAISDGETASATDAYQVYADADLKLFEFTDVESFWLYTDIVTARADTQAKEKDYQQLRLDGDNTAFGRAKVTYNGLSDFLKDAKLQKALADAQAAYDAIDGTIAKTQAAEEAINAFVEAVDKAKATDEANTEAFEKVKEEADAAVKYYGDAQNSIDTLLTGDRYDNLRPTAVTELNEAIAEVKKADDAVEAANKAGEAVAQKEALLAQIAQAKQGVTDVVTNYSILKDNLDAAYTAQEAQQKALDDVKKGDIQALYDEGNVTVVADVDAAQGLISDVLVSIKANDAKETIKDIDLNQEAVDAAIAKISTDAAPIIANNKAYNEMKEQYDGLKAQFLAAYEGYKELSKDYADYDVAAKWDGWVSNVQKFNFQPVMDNIDAAKAAGEAVNYQNGAWKKDSKTTLSFDTDMKEPQAYVDELAQKAPGAFNAYKALKDATDKYQEDLDAVEKLVNELDIYEETVNENARTPYKAKIEAIQAKIDAITAKVAAAYTKNDNAHYKAIIAVEDDSTIATDIKELNDNYKADQKAWEDQRDAQIAQNIKDNIQAKADVYDAKIAKALQDEEGKDINFLSLQGDVEKALADVRKAIDDARAADGTIAELTKVFNDLEALQSDIDDALDKVATYKTQIANYKAIIANFDNIDLATVRKNVVKADGNCTYYTGLIDNEYPAKIEALKADIAKDEPENWVTNKAVWEKKIADLKAEIEKLPALAKANLAEYKNQVNAYGDDKSGAVKEYNDLVAKMNDYPSSQLETQLAALATYKDKFDELKTKADTEYQQGKSASNGVAADITTAVAEMKAKVAEWTNEVTYNAQVAKDNKKVYEEDIPAAKKNAQDAYEYAANQMNAYNSLTSTEMKNALQQADAELQALKDLLTDFNEQLAEIQGKADAEYAATVSPAFFDATGSYAKQFNDKADAVKAATEAFLAKIQAAVNEQVTASVDSYDAAIAASKDKVKNFTPDDTTKKDAEITTIFSATDKLLADVKDAFAADPYVVKTLDNALADAAAIPSKITAIEQTEACAALDELYNTVKDLSGNLTPAEQTELSNLHTQMNTAAEALKNFDTVKAGLTTLKNTAETNKANHEKIDKAKTDIDATQDALADAYTTLDDYAAGAQLKGKLDAIQAQLDAVGDIDLDKADDATALAKTLTDQIKDITTNQLFDAEMEVLNGLVAQANDDYITYAGIVDEAEYTATKAEIDGYEKQIKDVNAAVTAKKNPETKESQLAMLQTIEQGLNSVIKKMQDKNGTNKSTEIVADLKAQLTAQQTAANAAAKVYTGTVATVKSDIAADKTAIDNAIADAQAYVTSHADDIAAYKANVEAKIADITAAVEALQKKAQEAEDEYQSGLLQKVEDTFADAQAAIDDAATKLAEAKEDLEVYGTTGNYSNKLSLLDADIAAANENLAAARDEADGKTKTTDKQKVAAAAQDAAEKAAAAVKKDVSSILGTEKSTFISGVIDKLSEEFGKIELNENNYIKSDYETLTLAQKAIEDAITQLESDATAELRAAAQKSVLDEGKAEISEQIADLKAKAWELMKSHEGVEKGHVAGNYDISSDDFIALAEIIINQQEAEADEAVCDINGDGNIDVTDLIWLRFYLVNGKWPATTQSAPRRAIGAGEEVAIQVLSTNDNITRVAVNLTNEATYQAFQLNMQLPEGARVVGKSLGERVEGASLLSSEATTGSVVFLAVSTAHNTFAGNNGAVLYVDIENLNGDITLAKAALTDTDFNAVVIEEGGLLTDVKEKLSNAIDTVGQKIYNVGGKLMDGLKKGINIIRNADGSTTKVVKK